MPKTAAAVKIKVYWNSKVSPKTQVIIISAVAVAKTLPAKDIAFTVPRAFPLIFSGIILPSRAYHLGAAANNIMKGTAKKTQTTWDPLLGEKIKALPPKRPKI